MRLEAADLALIEIGPDGEHPTVRRLLAHVRAARKERVADVEDLKVELTRARDELDEIYNEGLVCDCGAKVYP